MGSLCHSGTGSTKPGQLHYLRHIALVGNFRLLLALRNRIQAIEAVPRYEDLDGVQLTNAAGIPFEIPSGYRDPDLLPVGNFIGRVLRPTDGRLRFIGFPREVFEILAVQDYDRLLEWRRSRADEMVDRQIHVRVDARSDESSRRRLTADVNTAGIAFGRIRETVGS